MSDPTPQPVPVHPLTGQPVEAEPLPKRPWPPQQVQPAQAQAPAHIDTPADAAMVDARLKASIDDAYTLLDFACRSGKAPRDDIRDIVIDSRNRMLAKIAFTVADEATFWSAFATLTEDIKPVSVQSILFTHPMPVIETDPSKASSAKVPRAFSRQASPAEKSLRIYLAFAMITLLVLLMTQVEWAIGTFIYNDSLKVHHNLVESQNALNKAQALSDSVDGTPSSQQAELDLAAAKAKVVMDSEWADVSHVRLWWWNRGFASYFPPYDLSLNNNMSGTGNDGAEMESGIDLDQDGKVRLEFTRAELTLQVISNYLLVSIFSLMGSLTHAIRALSEKIQSVSLTPNALYRMHARIMLGVISGTCMASLYVLTTNDTVTADRSPLLAISFLGSFTPWAIAFLAGYSVELFFSLLERVVTVINDRIKMIGSAPEKQDAPSAKAPTAIETSSPPSPSQAAPSRPVTPPPVT